MEKRKGGQKQPYLARNADGTPFAFAGLRERWQAPEDEIIESCTILTTDANDLTQPIHDRMPVILKPADYDLWLDPQGQGPESVKASASSLSIRGNGSGAGESQGQQSKL